MEQADSPHLRTRCPACQSRHHRLVSHGVVSPWIDELAGTKQRLTRLLSCLDCKSSFFDIFYPEQTLDALYGDYRGTKYFLVRNSWEPTYTAPLNRGLIGSTEWIAARRVQIIETLEAAGVPFRSVKSIVDFGGGHGGVMPVVEHRYLIDKNKSISLDPKITRLDSIDSTAEMAFDLTMCCGVLEHVNDPQSLVQQIRTIDSKWYLFEVPRGLPIERKGPAKIRAILSLISKRRAIWRLVQSLERRVKANQRRYFPLRCSEHIQFFTEDGIRRLLEVSGFRILLLSTTDPNRDLYDRNSLSFQEGLMVICTRD